MFALASLLLVVAPGTGAAATAGSGLAPAASKWNELAAVSCATVRSCVAVGGQSDGTLAEAWNGTAWRIVTAPVPKGSTAGFLNGVSCAAVDDCIAVGYYYTGIDQLPLAESWNGSDWTIQPVPDPAGRGMTELKGVSCADRNACMAVGQYENSSYVLVTLAEAWNGARWKIKPTPNPKGSGNPSFALAGVSCTGPDACRAVGTWQGFSSGAVGATMAETWNGSAWKLQPIPNPKGYGGGILNGDSCAGPDDCAAVGDHDDTAGDSEPLAENWNGSAWAIRAAPDPARASDAYLSGVACGAADACTGVGYYYNSPAGSNVALAERWDGTSWTAQAPADPTADSILDGVSCPEADACVAVGQYYTSSGAGLTLAETWNGTRWAVQPTPNP